MIMNQFCKISFLAVLFATSISATIVEHAEFSSIFNYIQQEDYHTKTVIVLDIDNTIATLGAPFALLGGDAWVTYEINKRIQAGMDPKEAALEVLPLYWELTHIIDLRPVESITPTLIK